MEKEAAMQPMMVTGIMMFLKEMGFLHTLEQLWKDEQVMKDNLETESLMVKV